MSHQTVMFEEATTIITHRLLDALSLWRRQIESHRTFESSMQTAVVGVGFGQFASMQKFEIALAVDAGAVGTFVVLCNRKAHENFGGYDESVNLYVSFLLPSNYRDPYFCDLKKGYIMRKTDDFNREAVYILNETLGEYFSATV